MIPLLLFVVYICGIFVWWYIIGEMDTDELGIAALWPVSALAYLGLLLIGLLDEGYRCLKRLWR